MKIKVGKKYDREDGEVVKIVYESKIANIEDKFLGVLEDSSTLYADYYKVTGKTESSDADFNLDLVKEHSIWLDVKRDTLVIVRGGVHPYNLIYFDKYENGKVYLFREGRTSHTNRTDSIPLEPSSVKLYKKEED